MMTIRCNLFAVSGNESGRMPVPAPLSSFWLKWLGFFGGRLSGAADPEVLAARSKADGGSRAPN